MKKATGFLFLILAVSGCSATYNQRIVSDSSPQLEKNKGVLISTPDNGFYGSTPYPGSGRMTADAVRSAFLKHTDQADVTGECHGQACLQVTAVENYPYYAEPVILRWEDRASGWPGRKDVIEIGITVYQADTGENLSSVVLTGMGRWATFAGDHPQDLLAEPVTDYVDSLY